MKIEGKNQVRQALNSGTTINKIIIDKNFATRKDDIINLATSKKIKIEFLSKREMDKLSETSHHQGYIAEAVDFKYSEISDILATAYGRGEDPFVVLLDGIEDPHNLGACIRSCECAGVHGIIIPRNRACQVNETVVRTSAGATANMKVAVVSNLKDAIDKLRDAGLWIYVAESEGECVYEKNMTGAIGIVIGSEGTGVKKTLRSYCDGVVSLPLLGKVNSLNASVACGVMVFEITRQRMQHVK